jgi:hypothetical protein
MKEKKQLFGNRRSNGAVNPEIYLEDFLLLCYFIYFNLIVDNRQINLMAKEFAADIAAERTAADDPNRCPCTRIHVGL